MNKDYVDIIFIGVIAVILIYRLAKTLGSRPDGESEESIKKEREEKSHSLSETLEKERQDEEATSGRLEVGFVAMEAKEKAAAEAAAREAERKRMESDPIARAFYQMHEVDKTFNPESFLEGAKGAFELIVAAYNKGDVAALAGLVDEKVGEKFVRAIEKSHEKHEKTEHTLVAFKAVKPVAAALLGAVATITVEFETEQSKVVRNAKGEVIEGDAIMISTVIDEWTFRKNLKDKDPTWVLVAAKGKNG